MPKTNEYHLYVHLEDFQDKKDPVANEKSSMKTGSSSSKGGSATKEQKALKKIINYSNVKGVADSLINYQIGMVSLSTGQEEFSQRLQQSYSAASSILDGAVSTFTAFAINPVVGGISLASKVFSMSLEISKIYETLAKEKSLESVALGMSGRRAGITGRRVNNQ